MHRARAARDTWFGGPVGAPTEPSPGVLDRRRCAVSIRPAASIVESGTQFPSRMATDDAWFRRSTAIGTARSRHDVEVSFAWFVLSRGRTVRAGALHERSSPPAFKALAAPGKAGPGGYCAPRRVAINGAYARSALDDDALRPARRVRCRAMPESSRRRPAVSPTDGRTSSPLGTVGRRMAAAKASTRRALVDFALGREKLREAGYASNLHRRSADRDRKTPTMQQDRRAPRARSPRSKASRANWSLSQAPERPVARSFGELERAAYPRPSPRHGRRSSCAISGQVREDQQAGAGEAVALAQREPLAQIGACGLVIRAWSRYSAPRLLRHSASPATSPRRRCCRQRLQRQAQRLRRMAQSPSRRAPGCRAWRRRCAGRCFRGASPERLA